MKRAQKISWIVFIVALFESLSVASASVTVSPASVQVKPGAQVQFSATGSADNVVIWSLSGTGCSGISCGSITSDGLYTAPATAPNPPVVTVTATSLADLTQFGSASVTIGTTASVAVSVSPTSATVVTSGQQQFSASVTGTANTAVTWTVSGTGCVAGSCGTITSAGLYTAPAVIPNPAKATVTATSVAAPTKSASATVVIESATSIVVSVSPTSATVATSGQQQFSASVTGTSNTAVTWTVSGTGCVGSACGTISTSGLYTAPAAIPNPATATVTATSVAAPTRSASATIVIESATSVIVSVSPPTAQVSAGAQQQFSAKVTGSTNTSVKWTVTGAGCAGSVCGSISTSGLYTAPATVPAPPTVTVTATAIAAPTQSGKATVTIVAPASQLTISPSSPQVKPGGQVQFAATGPGSGVVIWSASGSGCSGITCGSITSSGLYTAPATVPSPATVTVTATSLSNPSLSGSTIVTVGSSTVVGVTVSPSSLQLNTGAQQQFKAVVTGTSNTAVTWSVTGYGCVAATCGTITSGGLYTAPNTPPNPSFVSVTATSVADSTKSSTATVIIMQGVAVSISPTSVQLAIGASQQFTAKVTNTTITGVTWSVNGTGCAGSACGTITAAGLYTAPDTVPTPAQVTVTATSTADGVTSASATVTIISPIQVTISPTNAIVTVGNQQQFRATVTGTTNTAVTWSVSGAGCSGAACGAITSAGLYTGPASVPNPANVTIKAVSQANGSSSASAAVTIAPTNNSKLDGQYAFLFTGFDSNGVYQAAGSFTANGQGKITSGLEDVNNTASPTTKVAISGTYQVGADNRGVMTISSPLGTHTFRFALNLLGTKGRFISFDSSGIRGSGVLELQDPTAFDASFVSGGYVLNLTGMDASGSRIGALGLIFPDGSSFISGSSLDVNDGGNVSPTFATFNGSYSVDDATGRGTVTLSIPGFDGGTFDFAFYIVSANEFLMISTDPLSFNNPIFSGPAELQSGAPFTDASFTGGSVFSLSGTSGSGPEDTVGRFMFNGSQAVTMIFDQNSGGNVTVAGVLNGAYDLELNGRGTLNLVDPATGALTIWYMYAIAPGEAFLMDASTGAVAVGEMKPQSIFPPISNSNILGTYLFGSGEPIVQTTPLLSGIANFDGSSSVQGQGNVTGTEDMSQSSTLTPNLGLGGTYSVSGVSNNGRGSILLTSPSGKTIAVWVTSMSEFVGLNVDSTTPEPTILYFEQ